MNKLCYRIVFNKRRGLCMAVQENASSHGKGRGQGGPASGGAPSGQAGGPMPRVRMLALAMLGAFGASGLPISPATAQIVADPTAAGRQQATVLNTANGVLQVNVQTPSAAGVSRNVYSRFDVPASGAVLNNSRTQVQTQLGGWIEGNPWMAKGTARVILNEVNSNTPSQLRGYMEVAGSRAEMVIANPAGIVVDGAGFINVSRATLTTGAPVLNGADGALTGYTVRRGLISFEGQGLDARQTDYTALIARSVQLNAGVWAQRLDVLTGANEVTLAAADAPDGAATLAPIAGSGEAPRYGIDAALLGGMYANKITLIGTEAGVGVRNAGSIGAAAGELVVTAEGRLENLGGIAASQALALKARGGVANSGSVYGAAALTVASGAAIDNSGTVYATTELALSTPTALTNSGTISGATGFQVTAGSIGNSGMLSSAVHASVTAQGDIDNRRGVVQAQSLALTSVAGALNNQSGKIVQSAAVALEINADSLQNTNGGQVGAAPVAAGTGTGAGTTTPAGGTDTGAGHIADAGSGAGATTGNGTGTGTQPAPGGGSGSGAGTPAPAPIANGYLRVANAINNDAGQIMSGGDMTLAARTLDNAGGQLNLSSLNIDGGGAFSNRSGQISVLRDFTLRAGAVDNHGGKLLVGGNFDGTSQAFDNGGGMLSAGRDLLLDSGAIGNIDGKLVAAGRGAINAAGAVDNSGGYIQAATALELRATGKLDNNAGTVEAIGAGAALRVAAADIDNTKGRIVNAGGAGTIGSANNILNTGVIGANGALAVDALTMQNQAGATVQAGAGLALAVTRQLDNAGAISSAGALTFTQDGATLINSGQIAAGADITIAIAHANNDGGRIGTAAGSGADLALSAADISNRGGQLIADRDLAVAARQAGLDNTGGLIHAERDAALQVARTLLNDAGVLETVGANSKLGIDSGALHNLKGNIVNAGKGDTVIRAADEIVSSGVIAGNGKLSTQASTLANSGSLTSGAPMLLTVSRSLDNSALISTTGTLDIAAAGADVGNSGEIYSVGDISASARHLTNKGKIATTTGSGAAIALSGETLNNANGAIMASGDAAIAIAGAMGNVNGTVQSLGDLTVTAGGALDNGAGVIEAAGAKGALQVHALSIDNSAGRIVNVGGAATGVMADTAIFNSGVIAGNGELTVTAQALTNAVDASVLSGADMHLALTARLRNDGVIQSAGALMFTETTSKLDNHGDIVSGGAMSIKAGEMSNDGGRIATAARTGSNMVIRGQSLSNRDGGILSDGSAEVTIKGDLDNRDGVVQTRGDQSLSAGGVLDNRAGSIETLGALSALNVDAGAIDNTGGRIVNAGTGAATVESASYIRNNSLIAASGALGVTALDVDNATGGTISSGTALVLGVRDTLTNHGVISSAGALSSSVKTGTLTNAGQIVSADDLRLLAGTLNNDGGQIATLKQSGADVAIKADSVSNRLGVIQADRDAIFTINGALNNAQGMIQAGRDLQVEAAGAIDNTNGAMEAIAADSTLSVHGASVDNSAGRIVNVGAGASHVHADGLLLNGGLLAGNGKLDVTARDLTNTAAATIASGDDLTLGVSQALVNQGAISSAGRLDFTQTTAAVRNSGNITAGGDVTLSAGVFDNNGGQLATVKGGGGDITLDSQSLANRGGVILADHDARLTVAGDVDNAGGAIQARQDMQLSAGGALNNNAGVIETINADSALRLQTGSIDNTAGRIVNVGASATTITAQGAIISDGVIAGNGTLDLRAATLANLTGGSVTSGQGMTLGVARQLDNLGAINSAGTLTFSLSTDAVNNRGRIVSVGLATIAAGNLDNDGGIIATLQNSGAGVVVTATGAMSNRGGRVQASGDALLDVGGALDNAQGAIQAGQNLRVEAAGAINNTNGVMEAIAADSTLNVRGASVDNSAGRIVNVGAGAAHVGADGLLLNGGLLAGNGKLDVTARTLTNTAAATIASGDDLTLGVSQELVNQGAISSTGRLDFTQTTAAVRNAGTITAGGDVTLSAGVFDNNGGQLASVKGGGGDITLDSQSLANRGGVILADHNARLTVAGDADNAGGAIQARQDMQLSAGGALNNKAGVIETINADSAMRLQTGSIDNTAGRIVNVGANATTITAQGAIVSDGVIAGNGTLDLRAATLANLSGGSVTSGQAMTLAVTQRLDNLGAINSAGTLTFTQSTAAVNNGGRIVSAGLATIAAGNLNNDGGIIATLQNSGAGVVVTATGGMSNHGGRVQASGDASLDVGGALDNVQGAIQAGGDMRLNAGGLLSNNAGVIEASAAGSALRVLAGSIDNGSGRIVNVGTAATSVQAQGAIDNAGSIAGNGLLRVDARSLRNDAVGTMLSGQQMALSLGQRLENHGAINSGATLDIVAATAQVSNDGTITSAGNATISAGNLNNDGGQIATLSNSNADITIDSQSMSNRGGRVLANGNADVRAAGAFDNAKGTLQAGQDLRLNAGGALGNVGGVIEAAGAGATMTVQGGAIDNTGGRIVNVGANATTITAQGAIVSDGVIAGNGTLDLRADTLRNLAGGSVTSGQAMTLGVTQRLDNLGAINSAGTLTFTQSTAAVNNGGRIVSAGLATIAAGNLNNDGGIIATLQNSGADVVVTTTGGMSNRGGRVQASGDASLDVGGALDNAQGAIQAGGDMRIDAGGLLSNNAGVIEASAAGSALRVLAGSIDNGSGRIVNVGTAATSVQAQGAIGNAGTIAGNGLLKVDARSLRNDAGGTVQSGQQMTLTLGQRLENHGAINSGAALDIVAATAQVSNNGTITSAGNATISAGKLDNDGGQIATLSNSNAAITIDSQSMSNRGGRVLANGNADVRAAGAFDNAQGTLQAGKDLRLNAGGALGNVGGVIEAAGAGATMTVQGGAIDNTGGRIVNVGNGDTTIRSQSSLINSGMIAGNGDLSLFAATARNDAAGTLASGGDLELAVTQALQNAGTVSSAGAMTFSQAAASFSNSGQIIAGGAAVFNAASFNNDGGRIATAGASGAGITVASGSISNQGGKILASGDAGLTSAAGLDNNAGTVQAGGDLKLDAKGALTNVGGALEAGGAASTLDVRAASIDSTAGRIVNVGAGATTIHSDGAIVNSGVIAGNGDLSLSALTLTNNKDGQIGAGADLALAVTQQLDNHAAIGSKGRLDFDQAAAGLVNDGQIVAGGKATIVAKTVLNDNGQIATAKGGAADLTVTTGSLSNVKGQILSDGKADLTVDGALNNAQGAIQSIGDLTIAAGGALDNKAGAIEAAGAAAKLTMTAQSIDNDGGRIANIGGGDTSVTSLGALSNNSGIIAGNGNLLISSTTLRNDAGGNIASGKDMALQVTQQLDNLGKINSGGTLTFDQAAAMLNNSGSIVSVGNALITARQVDNNGGQMGTGLGSEGDLTLTTEQLSNEAGHISTGRDLVVVTHVMQGNGELQGGRDLSLTMDGDYTQGAGTQQFHSNRDLSLTVTGNITNNATFEAVRNLTLSGNAVTNNAGAVIQGQGVTVKAAGDLYNAGEINGQGALDIVSGGTVTNTNAIVGGDLTLTAQNLNNTEATSLVGATNSMKLGVAGTVNNTGGATIYSAGGLAIGATLAGGQSAVVTNNSSTIEAAGDLTLSAGTLNNVRENVSLVKVQTVDETKQMELPSWSKNGRNNNNYDPNSGNYFPHEVYFVNPDDILENKIFYAADGNAYGRAVIRTHANDSAFFGARSGAYSAWGKRARITMTEGTRVLYYLFSSDGQANPDQGGPASNAYQYVDGVPNWTDAGPTFSSQYGSCSTNCVRFVTQPDYNDPTTIIIRDTLRSLQPEHGDQEKSRLAHHVAVEDQVAPGSGPKAQILSGGDMHMTVGQALTNKYGDIMATGSLTIDGSAAISNEGATLYRTHTFDGTWKTYDGAVTAYTMPTQSEVIGTAAGVISGGKGVSISGRSFSNVDVTAGTAGNIRDSVNVVATGNNSATGVSQASGSAINGGSAGGQVGGSGIGNNASGAGAVGGSAGASVGLNGQVGGSGIGNNASGAGAVGGSGGASVGLNGQAGASGIGNNASGTGAVGGSAAASVRFNGQAGASGVGNNASGAGAVGGSGFGNTAKTVLDTSGSGTINGARDADLADGSGRANGATANGAARGSGAAGGALGDVGSARGASQTQNASQVGGNAGAVKVAPNGLSTVNPDANGKYVFETRSQFANHGNWIGSDYLLNALAMDPATTQKRLGDAFYEQRLVRDQLIELTGRAPTDGLNDDSRYKALLTSAISAAERFDLRPGIALTADQVSRLTSDIVWMETQTVSLPDGSVEQVLVPKVYLAHAGNDAVKAGGALVTGAGVSIKTTDSIVNSGGLIDGGNGRTVLVAGQDIVNKGGAIKGGDVGLQAGRDVINQSLSVKQEYASVNTSGSYTTLSNQASITASGALGISAGRDVTDTGGTIGAASVAIQAGRDIGFNALQTGSAYVADVNGHTQNDSSVTNKVGQVGATGDLSMQAGQDIKLSGTQVNLGATGNGSLVAGRDISITAVVDEVKTHQENDPTSKKYDKIVHENQTVVGATVAAGGNLTIKAGEGGAGALAIAGSTIAGGGNVSLAASDDVSITQVQENHLSDVASHRESKSTFKKSSDTTADYSSVSNVIGSNVSGGAVTVKAGNDIVIGGSQLTAENALTLNAGRDLLVSSAEQTGSENHSAEHKKSGFSLDITEGVGYTKSQDNKTGSSNTVTQVGSVLSGGSVSATSGRDTLISGSTVVADKNIVIDAKRDLSIVSAENSVDSESASSSKKSGSIGTRFQAAVGTVKTTNDGTADSVTQVGSQIASLGGNVTLKAGGQYTQTSSEVTAPEGNIAIAAKDVLINAAMNVNNSTDHTTYNKTAIGGTITSPVLEAAKSVGGMVKAAQGTSDSRMQALAALNAAGTLMSMPTSMAGVTGAGLRVSISLGNSKSENNVVSTSNTVAGSTIAAGGNVSITATGAGKDSNLTAIGSDITAGGNVVLSADNDVNLLAAENTVGQHSTNKSSGASIGIGFGIGGTSNGFTIDLAVSQARGKADGDDIGYTNTHVNAGNNVTVVSGGDTTLKGGIIAADSVVAQVGGDLNIESLQDSSKFDSKQSSSGLNASLCIPPFCYGASTVGGSISKSKINGDFLSVLEQSGIKTGDGGFQVTVAGNTDLKGGLMSSSQAAVDQGNNALVTGSLTSSDLQNKDEYSASGFSMAGSVSGTFGDQKPPPGKLSEEQQKAADAGGKPTASAGIGSASGSQSSTTHSGISGGLVVITDQVKQLSTGKDADGVLATIDQKVTTESAAANASALTKGWDAQQLQKEVDAQVAITKEFSKQAPKAIASFADQRIVDIKVQIRAETDATKKEALKAELDKWDEGGAYRTALHTVSGALSGGLNGALGAMASASAANWMSDLQLSAIDALKQQGLSEEAARAAAQGVAELASLGLGMAVGGAAGAGAAVAVDTNNRQLNKGDRTVAKQLAKDSDGRYTEQQLLDALRQAGVKDRSGNVVVQEGTREYFVMINGQLTDPLTMKPIQETFKSDGSIILRPEASNPSRSLIEDKPSVPGNELMAYIIASTGGAASPYILTPSKTNVSSRTLPPGPENTYRVPMVADGQAYSPLAANCPAVSCTNGDPIAYAVDDAETKAYLAAVEREVEKKLNVASAMVGIGGALIRGVNFTSKLFEAASELDRIQAATAKLAEVWNLKDTARGIAIESHLAKTDYSDWFNIGQLNNGKFPMVDFQKGTDLVSLKTVDTTGVTWLSRIEKHIDELGSAKATVNGVDANMILDIRVQPGGLAEARKLIQYGKDNNVKVVVREF